MRTWTKHDEEIFQKAAYGMQPDSWFANPAQLKREAIYLAALITGTDGAACFSWYHLICNQLMNLKGRDLNYPPATANLILLESQAIISDWENRALDEDMQSGRIAAGCPYTYTEDDLDDLFQQYGS